MAGPFDGGFPGLGGLLPPGIELPQWLFDPPSGGFFQSPPPVEPLPFTPPTGGPPTFEPFGGPPGVSLPAGFSIPSLPPLPTEQQYILTYCQGGVWRCTPYTPPVICTQVGIFGASQIAALIGTKVGTRKYLCSTLVLGKLRAADSFPRLHGGCYGSMEAEFSRMGRIG
jgi:hypothetical protein